MLLGITFLFGGNQKCQNSIYAALKQDLDNVTLVNLNNLIKRIGTFLYKFTKLKTPKDLKPKFFNYAIEDTFDFYNSD